jgi:hypothetical protein
MVLCSTNRARTLSAADLGQVYITVVEVIEMKYNIGKLKKHG